MMTSAGEKVSKRAYGPICLTLATLPSVIIFKLFLFLVFCQAEDGMRYLTVTGVQTCALPIYPRDRVDFARAASQAITGKTLLGDSLRCGTSEIHSFTWMPSQGCTAGRRSNDRTPRFARDRKSVV